MQKIFWYEAANPRLTLSRDRAIWGGYGESGGQKTRANGNAVWRNSYKSLYGSAVDPSAKDQLNQRSAEQNETIVSWDK